MLRSFEINLTDRQVEELAKFCLDISKITLTSLVLGLITQVNQPAKLLLILVGFLFFLIFLILGLGMLGKLK